MIVEYFSTNYAPKQLKDRWIREITRVIDQGTYIGGEFLENFETLWSNFSGSRYAAGVSNGLDGLILALRSLDIGPGKCVAVPAHTFIATWNAVISVGAKPIGVDVDENGLIDLEEFRRIAPQVSSVIPVHMHGSTVDMNKLWQICNGKELEFPVSIIEDASQAHGAKSPDLTQLGAYSEIVVYSLYPTKNLGALGDAGVITTNKAELRDRLRSLSNYGNEPYNKYQHRELGFNNRLDAIQAAVLSVNIEYLENWNDRRRELSNHYIKQLRDDIDILQLDRTDSVRHHFCVITPKRDELRSFLKTKGVKTEIHYPMVAGVEASKFMNLHESFPVSQKLAETALSLPISQWHTIEQVDYVVYQIRSWLGQ